MRTRGRPAGRERESTVEAPGAHVLGEPGAPDMPGAPDVPGAAGRTSGGASARRASPRLRRSLRPVAAVAALALVGGGGYWFGARGTPAAAAVTPESTTQAVAASLTTIEKSVSASGTLTPSVQEEVGFEVSGTVTSVQVTQGQVVTAGQVLATVDTLELEADLLSARATLASAEADLDEAETDDDGTDAAEAQVAARAAQVEVAQAAVDTATEAMAGATLVAPVGGLLTTVDLEVGDVVSGSGASASGASSESGAAASTSGVGSSGASSATSGTTASFVIVGTDAWQLDVTVDDTDVALIAVGDQAEITIEDVADTVFGTVGEIGLVSTSTSGVAAYPVVVTVTGQPEGVYDGVAADVEIVYERRTDVLTVPSAAVRTVDGTSVVTQAGEDGEEISTTVTVGETVGDTTEITEGLVEGDEVLVTVVTQTPGSATTTDQESGMRGQVPEGFDPSQMQLPEGFDPSQLPGGPADG